MEYRERERQRKGETTRQASETQQEKWRQDARASDKKKKTKKTNFVGGATFTFCNGGEKIRNASSQQGEKRAALEKKSKKEYKQQNFFVGTYNNFSIERVMWKFHVATTTKKKCKKSVLHVQSCFLLIRFTVSLAVRSRCRRRLVLHDFIF